MATEKNRCGATTRSGGRCKLVAGHRTDHLGHGNCHLHGGCTPTGRTYGAREQAKAEAARLGATIETDPREGLELALSLVRGEVEFLRGKVLELDGEGVEKGELHPTARALGASVDRLSRISQIAAQAGVEERRLELDELVTARIGSALTAALAEVDLTAEQDARLREVLPQHLAALNDVDLRPSRRELAA